ncbi:uncharacterized protein PFL1_03321 [Pseudozyma flocculosa PF-1]|uniref:Glucose-6-phosphate 1-epimerase n=2 Tax=Pseudozyma flocculosa TaxID=84751 RepID=A0A5C3F8N7_9BASI|nr:uncharacterized protein PFL1_03321 [Pseudozyma flocculosa PF-1]EPQ29031.1 hypothetical protein PFL1_03321 [Pseudozyma flocculosa PF-1]SPO40025.1 related to Glucose-6-phosphate 1-epimerase [Pseudozyma flocculosa]
MPISFVHDNAAVRLDLPASKASVEIYLYGATVTSWRSNGGQERLFLSEKAALDGSAAIRGGIPLVFPVFGAPSDHKDAPKAVEHLAKHGFARTHRWSLSSDDSTSESSSEDRVSVTLTLRSSELPEVASSWPFETALEYKVTLTPNALRCQLSVEHLSTSTGGEMPFQALLHNYLLVPDSTKASVHGLQGQTCMDKLRDFARSEVQDAEVRPAGEAMDRAHRFADEGREPGDVSLHYNASLVDDPLGRMGKGVEVKRSANLLDTVVWNPASEGEKGIKDLASGDWKSFVCVEPGAVQGFLRLAKGQKWQAEQTLEAW